jgi:phenylpropionate dioxygenase-like ring-hydroxylating dioxygenase large terminal subunit
MTRPNERTIIATKAASSRMADRDTPFIFNAWYIAAFDHEISRELLQRTILGKRLVLFRTQAGKAVALDDRCPHRSFPLSSSTLDGDTIICGYHGFRYDTEGNCINVPSAKVCPKGIGNRSYKLIEQGKAIWIWMGNPDEADESQLPDIAWTCDSHWKSSAGYLHLPGSYVRLHENLMDLTHLSFLHGNSFGTPDYATSPFETELNDDRFALIRSVKPTTLPKIWAESTGMKGELQAARIARSEFLAPGLHQVSVTFYDVHLAAENRPEFHIRTAHLPTPETATSTHYFVIHGRDFVTQDQAMTDFMHQQLMAVFEEDVWGLGLQEEVIRQTSSDEFYEFSVPADGPAIAARRYLKQRADDEQEAKNNRQQND